MISSVCVCPAAPVLVPDLTGPNVNDLASLREAAQSAVAALVATTPDCIVVLCPDLAEPLGTSAGGSLAPWGAAVAVGSSIDSSIDGAGHAASALTLSPAATLGAWLLDQAGWQGERAYVGKAADLPEGPSTAVLVMGEGSIRRSLKAPGHFHDDAADHDASVGFALRSADLSAWAAFDLGRADVQSASAPRVLADLACHLMTAEQRLTGEVSYADAPLGVGYWVGFWVGEPAGSAHPGPQPR